MSLGGSGQTSYRAGRNLQPPPPRLRRGAPSRGRFAHASPRLVPAYDAFSDDQLTLRDKLAIDRTTLANERTFLAYARTAIGLLAGGVALLQLADAAWAIGLGWAALALSPLVMLLGIRRFWRVRTRLRRATSAG